MSRGCTKMLEKDGHRRLCKLRHFRDGFCELHHPQAQLARKMDEAYREQKYANDRAMQEQVVHLIKGLKIYEYLVLAVMAQSIAKSSYDRHPED